MAKKTTQKNKTKADSKNITSSEKKLRGDISLRQTESDNGFYDKSTTYPKHIVEIADFILSNLDKNREAVLSHYVVRYRKNRRTIERYYKDAQEYNKARQIKEEKVRNEVLIESTRDTITTVLKSKEYYLEELQNDFEDLKRISSGSVFKQVDKKTGNVIGYSQAGFNDEVQAKRARMSIVERLADITGWNAPIKTAETDSDGNDVVRGIDITIQEMV